PQIEPRTSHARAMAHHAVPFEDRRDFLFEEIRSRSQSRRASLLRYERGADCAERQKSASSVRQTPSLHLFSFCITERSKAVSRCACLNASPLVSSGTGFIRFPYQTNA